MMATEIIEIDAPWAEKWTKTRVSFLSAPTVDRYRLDIIIYYCLYRVGSHEPIAADVPASLLGRCVTSS